MTDSSREETDEEQRIAQAAIRQLTEYEKGYLEGLIEGEGSIILNILKNRKKSAKRGWQPQIGLKISNNSLDLLAKVQEFIPGIKIRRAHKERIGAHSSYVAATQSHNLLRWLLPQLSFVVPEKERRRLLAIDLLLLLDWGNSGPRNTDEGCARERAIIELCDEWIKHSNNKPIPVLRLGWNND